MQNVRANVKVLELKSFCIFSCILSLLIILIKPLTTKAYDRRASGDCGTSGYFYSNNDPTSPKGPKKQTTEPILGTALLEKKKKQLQPVEWESMAWLTGS